MMKLVNIADLKSAVERLVGSIPTTRTKYVPLVQLDRTSVFYTAGREFESLTGRQNNA
jgi:hypothetical protein